MIKVNNLCFENILKGISLQIMNKEIVTILGPNGAGKSTFIKSLAGILTPTQGDIEISQQTRCAYVSQLPPLIEGLNCSDLLLAYHYSIIGEFGEIDKDFVEMVFKEFNSLDFLTRSLSTLSGGELQRVILCCALSIRPQYLFLDEAFSSLDPHQYESILIKLKMFKKQSPFTLIIISHDINSSLLFSDRIIGIKKGEISLDKKSCDVNELDLNNLFEAKLRFRRTNNNYLQTESTLLTTTGSNET